MYSPDYSLATNAAYETLMMCSFTLPVKVLRIVKQFEDISIISYSEAAKMTEKTFEEIKQHFESDFGFLSRDPHDPWKAVIFYNDQKSVHTIRFTIAHELGHYVLGHLTDDDVAKKEANCFARNLLCPVSVGCTLRGNKIEGYMGLFNISEPMAKATVNLIQSDLYYITDKMHVHFSEEYEHYQFLELLKQYFPLEDKPNTNKKAPYPAPTR
ncbi:MAG: ImmA/IrrE family metallo-endopeptidase [Anaerotignum sp.]|nr:ImmA/IrrE family metallo-endopeptidase [Anaerotignum sp.]MBR5121928.1 ImmA/IrrE family metallo-endopeptidase [Anaerotignum sp.]